jgi:pilus assembly protein CpaC
MRLKHFLQRSIAASALASLTITSVAANAAPVKRNFASRAAKVAPLPAGTQRPTDEKWLSIGEGELITLPANVAEVWTSNPGAADVYVNNPRQIHLFGKDFGEATIFATSASGAVIYSTSVRVAQNSTSLDRMLKLAMPEADIKVTTVGQLAVINGTVASPDDSAQAQRFVTMALNPGIDPSSGTGLKIAVLNRLKTATPLQVNLQVRFAEVNRSYAKNIGSNFTTIDGTGGFKFGIGSGRNPIASTYTTDPRLPLAVGQSVQGFTIDPITGLLVQKPGTAITPGSQRTTIGGLTKFLGLDILGALDLGERIGQVTSLANPNLTALSGETGTFLAGGEIPIPVSQGLGATSVEYKQYGVSLAYTPTVLSDGRISLRVRPEVSQLDYSNAVSIGGSQVPGLTTRRTETTVELGSGQSFMIAGLLSNNHNNSIEKTPGAGDVPILGALFRSNAFQRNETELVIVITPYLVKPVNANDIVLPTDGYKAPTDLDRVLFGQLGGGTNGGTRPKPKMEEAPPVAPAIGAVAPAGNLPAPSRRREDADRKATTPNDKKGATPAPGFSIN